MVSNIFIEAKAARQEVARLSDGKRNEVLLALAGALSENAGEILSANKADCDRMEEDNPLRDRLLLTPERLDSIASGIRAVAALPSPLGRVLSRTERPNGLRIRRVSVPYGVIGVIYEARPNVTFDVFSLCFKSGNVCLLKGGKDAGNSNTAICALIRRVLASCGVTPAAVNLLPSTHEAAGELLGAVSYVDLLIPRGGRKLIDFVRDKAKVPCIETGAGVVNTYFDRTADLKKGSDIIVNAKTRRVSVCNALDCLLIHSGRLDDLPSICSGLAEKAVLVYADERAYSALEPSYPPQLLRHADADSYGREYLSPAMSVRTVDSLREAIEHISEYGSGHSEAIVTEDPEAAEVFRQEVDAACVYVNAPTSFTDGAQFGLGAEIGISTQKLGARGPMGLEEMTTCKWLIDGDGQIRP
ncbi:MAG: glutamate-5-semialdehyde dehydrogenase [Candidatus Cryptobacteroides sp.]